MDKTAEEIADELLAEAGYGKSKKRDNGPRPVGDAPDAITLDDFYAYMPMHNYIYTPSREPWPGASVNARVPPIPVVDAAGQPVLDQDGNRKYTAASAWLDRNRPVEQMTWAPGLPMIIPNRLVSAGGWIERDGVSCFNLYRPPEIKLGDAGKAGPWLEHGGNIYGDDFEHMKLWLAHRKQRPQEKINHALVLGGPQGVGKDTLLEPVKRAVGPWNFSEVTPQHMFGRFNGFVKSVILRVSEARDLGDVNRFSFYDHMKGYTAAPPDVLRVDEKNLREYSVLNCCGVIITTNHKADGIFLPADDRRHHVGWSDKTKDDFAADYWTTLWGWYENDGGHGHVAAYLASLDISRFDPKVAPPKTAAFWDIVDANRASEDAELADVLDGLQNPAATTLVRVQNAATGDFEVWIRDRKHRRQIPYRFEQCGYVPVRNEAADDGLWRINDKRQVVYAKASLSLRERLAAAERLTGGGPSVSEVSKVSDLASPLKSERREQFNGDAKSLTSPTSPTRRGEKSDDLLYRGPPVSVPDLGPDPFDEHGAPAAASFVTTLPATFGDWLPKLQGTSLDRLDEYDALLVLNRGAKPGQLTPVVKGLIEDAIAGKKVSAWVVQREAERAEAATGGNGQAEPDLSPSRARDLATPYREDMHVLMREQGTTDPDRSALDAKLRQQLADEGIPPARIERAFEQVMAVVFGEN